MHSFKYIDSIIDPNEVVNYPILNSLDLPGLPPHNLQLKVGSVIIMLPNLNQPKLCKGEDVLIPRIPLMPTDFPFEFKRIQLPVRHAFGMTINLKANR